MEGIEMDSILTSIKQMLGITEEYEHFDMNLILLINSAFSILNQLGVGVKGFSISDDSAVWTDFLEDETGLEMVKEYVYLKVNLAFDPPTSSFVLAAKERILKEVEWRINVYVDPSKQT